MRRREFLAASTAATLGLIAPSLAREAGSGPKKQLRRKVGTT